MTFSTESELVEGTELELIEGAVVVFTMTAVNQEAAERLYEAIKGDLADGLIVFGEMAIGRPIEIEEGTS